ncbi:MAG: DUF481 domain-containing protein [Myxococcaceae bacterium]
MTHLAMLLTVALAQAPAETQAPAADRVEQAVQAAQKAAEAAQKAAEAAQKAAEAAAAATAPKGPEPIPATPAPPAPGEKKDTWRGLVGVGLIALTGNAETLTGTANAQADKSFGPWAVGLRLNGAYGQTKPQDGGAAQQTALKAAGSLRGERSFVDFASGYLMGGLETDHIKSVELREYLELGSGLKLFERKEGDFERLYLRFDIAFRYQNESRYQYIGDATTPTNTGLPGVQMVAPHFGLVFRYSLNKGVHFSEEAEVLPNLVGASRVIVNSTTKLSAQLTETFSLSGSYIVNFDSAPAGNKKTTDTALTLGLEAAF